MTLRWWARVGAVGGSDRRLRPLHCRPSRSDEAKHFHHFPPFPSQHSIVQMTIHWKHLGLFIFFVFSASACVLFCYHRGTRITRAAAFPFFRPTTHKSISFRVFFLLNPTFDWWPSGRDGSAPKAAQNFDDNFPSKTKNKTQRIRTRRTRYETALATRKSPRHRGKT